MDVKTLPLSGIKVLDLSRVLAGPWCTQLLADLGADVLKIERPGVGDDTRSWGPPFLSGQSAYFLSANRNKRSLSLDFSIPDHVSKLKELISKADVIVENFKEKTREQFTFLQPKEIHRRNPGAILVRISGFDRTSSWAHRSGYDAVIQSMSGLMSVTGEKGRAPVRVGVAVADILTGLYAANGIQAALLERMNSKKGQVIDVSLFDVQVSCLANVVMDFLISNKDPEPCGNAHPHIVPYQAFRTKTDYLFVAVGNDLQFKEFSSRLKQSWHLDERFQTNPMRVKNREELIKNIQSVLEQETKEHWMNVFSESPIPMGPIHKLSEVKDLPYAKEVGLFRWMDDKKTPTVKNPLKFSRTPLVNYKPPPQLNEDSDFTF